MWYLVVVAWLLMGAGEAVAEVPACEPALSGTVVCIAGKLCLCRLAQASAMTGEDAGHRWDCDALRPRCPLDGGLGAPGGLLPWLPQSLSLERNTVIDRDRHDRGKDGR